MPSPLPDGPLERPALAQLAREPASLVRRACAAAVDLALAALFVAALAGAAAGWLEGTAAGRWLGLHPRLGWSVGCALPAWIALSLLEALPGRAGAGKRLLGLRVEGPRAGEWPSFARIALRTAVKLVPFYVAALALLFPRPWDPRDPLEPARLIILLGSNLWIGIYLASAAMTRRRQSLHDLASGTVVLDAPRGAPAR